MTDNVPTPHPEDQQDTYTDLTARLAAADLGWSHEHGDPPANPDYIKRLAFQVMAFKPPLIAGIYVDDEMLDDMRDRLHGDNCGCGEWDSHSQEYVERMDETIHAVLYPLRHPARPVPQGTEDSDYREQIARVVESHTPHDRVSEWQDINSTVTAVLAVSHPDTAEAARLRTDLTLAAAEAEDARDGGLDLAHELAEVRESRDQYHKNWDAAVAANMTALDTIGGLRADLETRTYERDEAESAQRQVAAEADGLSAMLREMARRVGDVRKDWLNRVRLDWHCHNHDCHRGHASDYVGSYSVCLDCSTEDREVVWYRCDDNSPTPAQVRASVAKFDERISDLQAEYAKNYESWDRQRQRLATDLAEANGRASKARQELAGEKHVRRLNEHGLLGQLAALRSIAVVLPEDWREQVAAKFGYGPRRDGSLSPRSLDVAELIESWLAAPVEAGLSPAPKSTSKDAIALLYPDMADEDAPVKAETPDEHVREHDDAAPTRTGADWCPSCRVEVGTNRYRDDDGTERCGTCGSELAESAPLADLPHEEWRAFREAVTGVDPGAEPAEPQAEPAVFQHRALVGHVGDETKRGRVMEALPDGGVRVRWDDSPYPKVHNPAVLVLIASPGTGTEAGE